MAILVRNTTPFRIAFLPSRISYPGHDVTVIVKGTFRLTHGDAADPVPPEEQLHLAGDLAFDDEREASLSYASDFAPFKPRADVLLVGTCHTPRGAPRDRALIGIDIGSVKKRVSVVGDREWKEGPSGVAIAGRPQAFSTMPLRWERAFGGPGFEDNPIGCGLSNKLPNLEHPSRSVTARDQRPPPVGVGPVDRRRPVRTRYAGTYDRRWLEERWPHFPADFDYRYFNAAPEDQQIDGYLSGDEPLVIAGVDPDRDVIETRLPGVRVRCVLRRKGAEDAIEDVAMRLDTLWIDADERRLVLVWRGTARAIDKRLGDVGALLFAAESLSQPAATADQLVAVHGFDARAAETALDEEPSPPAGDPPPAAREAGAPSQTDGDAETIAEALSLLEQGSAPPDLVARARQSRSLSELLEVLAPALPDPKPGFGAAELAAVEGHAEDLLASSGAAPSALARDEMPVPPEPGAAGRLSREEVERRARAGETLADCDLRGLDLRGIDLSRANLQRAVLDGCNLEGGRLTEADLTDASARAARFDRADLRMTILLGAILEGASLIAADLRAASASSTKGRGALFSRANLEGADLTAADLSGASFEEACIRGALFDEAKLASATLVRAEGTRARLASAQLDAASLAGARLEGANLRGATVEGATFEGAHLKEASLEGAVGGDVILRGADLSQLRGAGARLARARLEGARAVGSIWTGAALEHARFERAALDRADFTEASLAGASFDLAVLKYATFAGADLGGAALTRVNLFRGSLEGADLSGADVRGSNLFECELLDATTAEARFEGTNLQRTKLSPGGVS